MNKVPVADGMGAQRSDAPSQWKRLAAVIGFAMIHATHAAPAAVLTLPAPQPAATSTNAEAADASLLFDGRSLRGWKESAFTGSGKIKIEDGRILLGLGYMTGITWTNELPRTNYEISLEAMRVEGSDFFCGLTFPTGQSFCSLIVGGWGGSVVGLSCLDYADAANNETTRFVQFENNRWYRIKLRVEPERLLAWIDDKQVVDVRTADRKISIRSECEPSRPLGIATWSTAAALRQIKLRRF
jgi:hypothetical protein